MGYIAFRGVATRQAFDRTIRSDDGVEPSCTQRAATPDSLRERVNRIVGQRNKVRRNHEDTQVLG